MEAIKRVEELTYQVEALMKENAGLRVQVADSRSDANRVADELVAARAECSSLKAELLEAREDIAKKYAKIGQLIKDNGRLIRVNAFLAAQAALPPAKRKYDEQGNFLKP